MAIFWKASARDHNDKDVTKLAIRDITSRFAANKMLRHRWAKTP